MTALERKQPNEAVKLFDTMSAKELLPLHEIDRDCVRQELGEKFARNVLGLTSISAEGGPLELLQMKLAREPSIRGHKQQGEPRKSRR